MAAKRASAKKTTKTAAKRTTRRTVPRRNEMESDIITSQPEPITAPIMPETTKRKKSRKTFLTIGIIIIILLLIYLFRSAFVIAFVNGQPITRNDFNHQMEKDAGKQAMNELLTQDLILQEAQKKHITVSQSEIDKELKTIQDTLKKQGQSLDQALAAKGLTKQDLENQIKVKIIVDKLLGSKIKITDAQVNDYIDKNKDSFPAGQDPNSMKSSIKQRMYQDQLSTKFQEWIQSLQQKAKINYLDKTLAQ